MRSPSNSQVQARASTVAEDTITLGLCSALVGGMFLDGYAHSFVIDTATEDFFTPWHAIFYASFAALAAWIAFLGYRRRSPGGIIGWFPEPYQPALVGLGLFAVGGVGDGIWHTIFGIETGIDALLSPTHLLLFVGGVLIAWTPVRTHAARRSDRSDPPVGAADDWLAIGSIAIVTAVIAFFNEYLWVLARLWYPQQRFTPSSGQGQLVVQAFFASALVSTVVLFGPLLAVIGRRRLPVGAATVVLGTAQTLESLAFSQSWQAIGFALVGGIAFDTTRFLRPHGGMAAPAALGAATLWTAYLLVATREGNQWPAELLTGLVMVVALAAAGLALLQRSDAPHSAHPTA